MGSATVEKYSNPEYDEDDFLDDLIRKEIDGVDIKGDIVIVDGYGFEIDRSVPKIGKGVGKEENLEFPTVDATVTLADKKNFATIAITAKEEKNGINKIEIWQLGEKIDEFTYDNEKTEIAKDYIARQNGKYKIKVYGKLMRSKIVEVSGIVEKVKYEPNGNKEWKKEHQTKATIEEMEEKVVKAQYYWSDSVIEPEDDAFQKEFESGNIITENSGTLTGTYYLWTMLTTENGEKIKYRSEGFNFDNEGPEITEFTATESTKTAITLSATAIDTKSGTTKFEFYVDGDLKDTQTCTATTNSEIKSKTIEGLTTGTHECKVIVYDKYNNPGEKTITGTTKLHVWDVYSVTPGSTTRTQKTRNTTKQFSGNGYTEGNYWMYRELSFDSKSGTFSGSDGMTKRVATIQSAQSKNPGGWYLEWGSTWIYFKPGTGSLVSGTYGSDWTVQWSIIEYSVETTTSPSSQGSEQYEPVTSEDITKYPKNGEQDSKWYVLRKEE